MKTDNLVEIPGCFFMSAYPCISAPQRAYTPTMKILNEMTFDFDIRGPKIIASAKAAVIDNIKGVVLISDESVTVDTGKFYVTVKGQDFTISEIWEGRLELEGHIEGIEFYQTPGANPH